MIVKGNEYTIGEDEVIHLVNPKPFEYNEEYIRERYDSYGWQTTAMSLLRLHFIRDFMNIFDKSVLDVGYGNSNFLETCNRHNMWPHGYDVSGYPLGKGIVQVDNMFDRHYDLITFFDSLEHFEDISFVEDLDCKYICISVPWCHYPKDANLGWFETWKHLRPDEHLHHFTRRGLEQFMATMGYSMLEYNNIEDLIRGKGHMGMPNILTAFFTRGF